MTTYSFKSLARAVEDNKKTKSWPAVKDSII